MVSELPNKNCWTLAEHAGDRSPDAMQHLLSAAVLDEDGLREDLRDYVVERLGGAGAILVVDESGDLKKGTKTVGVQRQYTGTAGRIENSQVAVYLGYVTETGHAFLDAELYLPKSWTSDRDRCTQAGVPDDVGFATEPALAQAMITRALDAGVRAPWVTGDEVYGADPGLRGGLEAHGVGYVLAIARDRRVNTTTGRCRADADPMSANWRDRSSLRQKSRRLCHYFELFAHPTATTPRLEPTPRCQVRAGIARVHPSMHGKLYETIGMEIGPSTLHSFIELDQVVNSPPQPVIEAFVRLTGFPSGLSEVVHDQDRRISVLPTRNVIVVLPSSERNQRSAGVPLLHAVISPLEQITT
ncbi:IS701 family transposase [Nocardia higoensis]|uniref:IS701 family transposase n=1 Tax=Nocardia higoensis TaxID=228599 RepID=A0ABS0DGT6_9NOCA|nr:IS701 family transposase [Nocardia higoensis]